MEDFLSELGKLVHDGGPVMIALVVLCSLGYLAFKYILTPMQRTGKQIADSMASAAESNKIAAVSHEETARINKSITDSNAIMASHLARVSEALLAAYRRSDGDGASKAA